MHDAAAFGVAHIAGKFARAQQIAGKVDVKLSLPLFDADFSKPGWTQNTGGVDQPVAGTQPANGRCAPLL
ncbi:Uncharacterised protein [Kluyvera cryocrescens]|uniref:Uncharacterized protein n=1 Tax=Kluyvera cryocrescens TaxID=580 RepID=A0A485CFD5_KLUCR|nr:Uncharacterised protein [Kluyvera cryocrescens]